MQSTLTRQPGALEKLVASRPEAMKDMQEERLDAVRNLLRSWLSKFCQQSLRLTGDETDESAIDSLWQLARSAQEIIVCCTELRDDEDVPGIVVQWLRNYFFQCTNEEADLNEKRLRALLAMHQDPSAGNRQIDPWAHLQRYGATLPQESPLELAFALAARLEEAQRGNEMEVFTCEEIIQDGRLAPGMAAVVRRDPDAVRGLHVFIYEHSSIQNWQARCSNDPCTRCPLSANDIIRISKLVFLQRHREPARSRLAAEQLEVLSQREAASIAALDHANARLKQVNDEHEALQAQLTRGDKKTKALLGEIDKLSSPVRAGVSQAVHQGPTKLRLPVDHPLESTAANP
eukprot:symbB.v1.2.017407.t1/scaffold1329.1/size125172/3